MLTHVLNLPVWIVCLLITMSACAGLVLGAILATGTDDYKRGREDAIREMYRSLEDEEV